MLYERNCISYNRNVLGTKRVGSVFLVLFFVLFCFVFLASHNGIR